MFTSKSDVWPYYVKKRRDHLRFVLDEAVKYGYHSLVKQYSHELEQLENRYGSVIRDYELDNKHS